MESNPSNISKLQKLGLTEIQAKIYLIMINLEKETAGTIAKIANVDRSNVYKAIDQLQKQKIVSKMLGSPNLYETIPLEEGLELLIKAKSDQFTEVIKEAELLKKSYNDSKKIIQSSEYNFGWFRITRYSKKAQLKRIAEVWSFAQKNIAVLVNKKSFIGGVVLFPECHLRSLERGVKYRLITEVLDVEYIKKELNQFLRFPNFEIRLINYLPPMDFSVIDNKEVGFAVVPDRGIGKTPVLVSNHVGLIEIALNHFDTIWNKAKKINS